MIAANYRVYKRATPLRTLFLLLIKLIEWRFYKVLRNQRFFFERFLFPSPRFLSLLKHNRERENRWISRETRIFVNDWVDKKKGNYDWKSKRFRRAMKLDAPHKSVSTHMAEIDKAICLMQFDARVDAFVPRVGDRVDAMRFFFGWGEKKSKRFRNQRSRSNGRALSMMSTKVSTACNGVLDSETITRNAF